jgi:transcription initiation factor TFIIB
MENQLTSLSPSGERVNLKQAKILINSISEKLHLSPEITREVFKLYLSILSKENIQGRSIKGYISASFYYTLIKNDITTNLSELPYILGISSKELLKYHHLLLKACTLKVNSHRPEKYVVEICRKLGLDNKIEKMANYSIQSLGIKATSGKNPKAVAAASVYQVCLVSGIQITKKSIAESAGIQDAGLRLRYNELYTSPPRAGMSLNQIS